MEPPAADWTPSLAAADGPLHRAIAAALARDLAAGRLPPGARLPSHRGLATALGVSVGVVTRAYALAERDGLIRAEPRRGMVAAAPPSDLDGIISLRENTVAFEEAEPRLRSLLADAARTAPAADLFGYRSASLSLDEASTLTGWLADHGGAPGHRPLLCAGAQHGMLLALLAAPRRNGRVAAPALVYPGVRPLLSRLGLAATPLPEDEDGPLPDALATAGPLDAVILDPALRNPNGRAVPAARIAALAEAARAADALIIEDDSYRFVDPALPDGLARHAPERTVHLVGFAKSFAPGLRVGMIGAPPELEGPLAAALHATMVAPPGPSVAAALAAIRSGLAAEIAAERAAAFRRRRAAARAALAFDDPRGHPASPHLWLKLPPGWTSNAFAAAAEAAGVRVAPAEAFALDPAAAPTDHVRLSLGAPASDAALGRALDRLAALARPQPDRGVLV